MRTGYLGATLICLIAWMVLQKMDSQLKWVALGVGIVMLLFSIFYRRTEEPVYEDLTKLEGGE